MNNEQQDNADAPFAKLEALIRAEAGETRQQIGNVQADVTKVAARVDAVAARVDAMQVDVTKLAVRTDDVHYKAKVVAEGHATLIDHIATVNAGIERLETGQTSLVLRMSVVESRVTDVEKTQRVMLAEVRSLAARR